MSSPWSVEKLKKRSSGMAIASFFTYLTEHLTSVQRATDFAEFSSGTALAERKSDRGRIVLGIKPGRWSTSGRSFATCLPTASEACFAILRAITGFGMTITAEGVETEEQMRQLNLDGCVEVQGYLYIKPVPAGDLKELLARLSNASQGCLG